MKKILQFRRERAFVMVDYAVVMSGQLSVYELAVYLVLCAYADSREGTCFPSYQTIAGKAGCSRRKAIDAVARLESLGLIRKEVRKNPCGDNTSNLYTVVAAPPIAAPPPYAEGTPADALHFLVVYAGIERASCKSECRDLRIRCSRLRIAPSLTPSRRAIPVRGSPSQ